MEVNHILLDLRTRNGLTQEKLAQRVFVTR